MNRHLDDVEIALLVHGRQERALSREAMEHLAECAACQQELAFIVRAEAAIPLSQDATLQAGSESSPDPTLLAGLSEQFRLRWAGLDKGVGPMRLRRLFRLPKDATERLTGRGGPWALPPELPLAADSSSEQLPVLYLEDPELMICFRQAAEGQPIRAYVLAKEAIIRRRLFLHLPNRQLSLRIPMDGVIDLAGIDPEDLMGASIAFELDELSDTTGSES